MYAKAVFYLAGSKLGKLLAEAMYMCPSQPCQTFTHTLPFISALLTIKGGKGMGQYTPTYMSPSQPCPDIHPHLAIYISIIDNKGGRGLGQFMYSYSYIL